MFFLFIMTIPVFLSHLKGDRKILP